MGKAKKMLREIRTGRIALKALEEKREMIAEKATRITGGFSMAPSSSKGKTDISKSIVDLYELDDAIEKTIAIITRREKVAIDLIGKLKSEKYRTLLILYYIAGDEPKTWEEVAREMNYSVYTLWHDHGNALQEYQNLMNDNMAENSS